MHECTFVLVGWPTYTSVCRYYNIATDFYENAWGESFHFCRFAHGEAFPQAIARHEHLLAAHVGLRKGMKVLDVGCGVGGPAREMVKFAGCHVTGLNINEYQVQRAKSYAEKEGLAERLDFVQGDFMVGDASLFPMFCMRAGFWSGPVTKKPEC